MSELSEIRKAIEELSSREVKQILLIILLQLDLAETNKDSKTDLYINLQELYIKLLTPLKKPTSMEPNASATTVHIVFGDSIAGGVKLAANKRGLEDTHKIISFRDRFSIGPLLHLEREVGRTERSQWFRDNINDGYEGNDYVDNDGDESFYQILTEQIAGVSDQASIVIWSGNNAHEQVGLRYAVYLLRNNPNAIYVFNAGEACHRRFNPSDRSMDYVHTGEIPNDKLEVVFEEIEKGRPIAYETRQSLESEWLALAQHHNVLRIWDGEQILNVDDNYFDSYLLETVEKLHNDRSNHDFIKTARVIGEALGHCDQYIGDHYFEYRLRHLIYTGQLEIKGVPRAMRYYSVRRI